MRRLLAGIPIVPPRLHLIQAMWNARRAGQAGRCAACERPRLALSVEGPRSYQWHCMHCGAKSAFFFVHREIVRVHASTGVEDLTPTQSIKEP